MTTITKAYLALVVIAFAAIMVAGTCCSKYRQRLCFT